MKVFFEKFYLSKQITILAIIGVIFFVLYSWFPFATKRGGAYFASPDETANYFWSTRYAQSGSLTYAEPLNLLADDAVVPRSVRSDEGVVKPASFLGIILIYGTIANVAGSWIIPFLTPFFAILGVLFFYGIIKKIFDERIALWSALLLFALAPYGYYAARGLFHNVLFGVLVLAGTWLCVYRRDEALPRLYRRMGIIFLSGITFGLAVMTRTAELIWLGPAALIGVLFYYRAIAWRPAVAFIGGFVIAMILLSYYNTVLYGGIAQSGYEQGSLASGATDNVWDAGINRNFLSVTFLREAAGTILPFGFHPRVAWRNFVDYYVILLWYLFWPALAGGLLYLWQWREKTKIQQLYFIIFVTVSIILGVYYGSWSIQDSIARSSITIGNSYARYWLPIYIMSVPLAVWLFRFAGQRLPKFRWVGLVLFGLFAGLNFQTAVFGTAEGLYYTKENITQDSARARNVLTLVEPDAIIATKHLDKNFWPERKVISTDLSEQVKLNAMTKLLEQGIHVYYYGFIFTPENLALLTETTFAQAGIYIEQIQLDYEGNLGLYKVTSKK